MRLRYIISFMLLLFVVQSAVAKENKNTEQQAQPVDKKEIVKTGYNFGPLPAVAFDADKGFQLGALLNIYAFGEGSTYPNTRQQGDS